MLMSKDCLISRLGYTSVVAGYSLVLTLSKVYKIFPEGGGMWWRLVKLWSNFVQLNKT